VSPGRLATRATGDGAAHAELKSRNTKNAWAENAMSDPNSVTRKKRGRPAIGQDPILTFRLPLEYKQAIDRWRSTEPYKRSRSEAIRWLIGQGLGVESKKRTK
jgi:hypothetical protein